MKKNIVFLLDSRVVFKLLLLEFACSVVAGAATPVASASPDRPQTVAVGVTNWIPHFITNVIEVRMPKNQFVDEFRTNWVVQFVTNVVDVYRTNLITQMRTNEVEIRRVETREVLAYKTNLVYAYQTNWVKQPMTNVVNIELPSPTPAAVAVAPPAAGDSKVETVGETAPPADALQDLVIELTRKAGSAAIKEVNVQMALKSAHDLAAVLPVQEWRVERSDNTVLVFGQHDEFRGKLPPGAYKITAKVRSGEKSPFLTANGDIIITSASGSQRIPARISPSGK